MKILLNGIIRENPIFVLLLGLCSTLAVTTTFEGAYMMGLCMLVVLVCSSIIISIIRKLVPENVKVPVFILIIGTFVTIIELLLSNYVPALYKSLGVYLPLIVVNCIVLGRSLSVYSKNGLKRSILDSIGIGLGYTLTLCIMGVLREVLGHNTITIMDSISNLTGYRAVYSIFPSNDIIPISFLTTPAGSFLLFGLLLGIFNHFKKGGDTNE